MKLELLAADQLALADVAAREGRDVEAAQLRESAMTLLAAARPVSSNLEMIRRTMPSSWQRTTVLEELMHQARGLANAGTSAQEVKRLFDTGTDGDRVSAIGIMQARPEFADLDCLAAAVMRSRSAFEQYQALRAVDEAVSRLPQDSALRADLLTMVADALARDTLLRDSSDRRHLAERLCIGSVRSTNSLRTARVTCSQASARATLLAAFQDGSLGGQLRAELRR
ncbi:hypothetical protein [Serinicoccus chungangensis]|uniref:hypothetical protein n=1 Tax=Serinicoccus chungangensis TaxID=767452 RepID=UPI001118B2F6|nr:hypothetical protein [Serinicoccus chungangensis]